MLVLVRLEVRPGLWPAPGSGAGGARIGWRGGGVRRAGRAAVGGAAAPRGRGAEAVRL